MMGAAREGGLLLTEEKCCRLSSEDNRTEFVMQSCVCCRCAFMRAFLFSCLLLCFCGCV